MESDSAARALSAELLAIEERVRDADQDIVDAWTQSPTYDALSALLRRAVELGAVSPHFRVRFHHAYERMTLRLTSSGAGIELGWEHLDGDRVLAVEWTDQHSFAEVMYTFRAAVRTHGDEYGAAWVDISRIVTQIGQSLRVAIESRNGRGRSLDPVIEVFGKQWALTEYGLECLEDRYIIAAFRVSEMDWRDHMSGKVWLDQDDFDDALYVMTEIWSRYPERIPHGGRVSVEPESVTAESDEMSSESYTVDNASVFIVHGHDNEFADSVARLLERITSLRSVILHEQPDGGQTIIEKFEAHASGASFAVILMTPDDEVVTEGATIRQARPNVLLELGYFIGRLGRDKVAVLRKPDTAMPSDFGGVLYKSVDTAGAWRLGLAHELQNAGIQVDYSQIPT